MTKCFASINLKVFIFTNFYCFAGRHSKKLVLTLGLLWCFHTFYIA